MKRIEFIAPVSAMRGNLSGAQDLKYPTQDNKAYEGPLGGINYARNYTPRFVGAKVAQTGNKYFTTRTKSANHLTAASKHAMALMGGVGAMVASLYRDKTTTIYQNLRAQWLALQERGDVRTFRKYISDGLREMLANKATQYAFTGPEGAFTVQNPWRSSTTANVPVSNEILVKFWGELANNGIYFNIDNEHGVANSGDSFQIVIGIDKYNVLGLEAKTIDGVSYVAREVSGNYQYVRNADGDYIKTSDTVEAITYRWSLTAPEA